MTYHATTATKCLKQGKVAASGLHTYCVLAIVARYYYLVDIEELGIYIRTQTLHIWFM